MLHLFMLIFLGLDGSVAFADPLMRRNSTNAKMAAPGLEDHAAFFSQTRKGISASDLARVDNLRLKTISSIRDLLEKKGKSQARFELLLRLGELYIERHDYLRDIEMDKFSKAWDTWNEDSGKSNRGAEPKADVSGSERELAKAANAFRILVSEFPNHPRADTALYALAQSLARLGKEASIQYYKKLIRDHPKSRLIPDTYLSLGEYYFDKHKISDAISNYTKVTSYRQHRAYLYAIYKLGWAHYNAPQSKDGDLRQNYKKAVSSFKRVIKLSSKASNQTASNFDLREEAIRDLVMVWAEAEEVESAWKYFRMIGEKAAFYSMLERLGGIYYDQGKNQQAIAVFKRLLEEASNRGSNPEVHAKLVELNDVTNNLPGVINELKNMKRFYNKDSAWVRANKKSPKGDLTAAARALVEKTLHRYGAMYHQRGQKTKMKAYFTAAATIYELYLESFPQSSSAYDIRYYLAEIQYDSKQYVNASRNYLLVAKQDYRGKYFKPSALNAVASLHDLVESRPSQKFPPPGKVTTPLLMSRERKLLIDTMESYLKLLPREKEADNMRFEIAQTYFMHGHYPEAIKRFDELTRQSPDTKQAKSAVRIILGFYAGREEWSKLIAWCKTFNDRRNKLLDDPLRKSVNDLLRGAMFKQALAFEKQQKHERAARGFLDYQREFPADSSADRALYNATINFYKCSATERALATGRLMLDKYPRSSLLPDVLSDMASTYEGLAQFEDAALMYKRLGLSFVNDTRAPGSLYNAAILYKGLKNYDESIAVLGSFARVFGDSKIAPEAAMELANLYERTGQIQRAVKAYSDFARKHKVNQEQVLFAEAKAAVLETFHASNAAGVMSLERIRSDLIKKDAPAALQARETVAAALFKLVDPLFVEFVNLKINDASRLEKLVREKQDKLVQLSKKYEEIVDLGSGEFTVASTYRMGEAHENFANTLLRVPVPKGISQGDIDKLKTELERVAFPLRDEAYKFFEMAHKRSGEVQTFTVWTRRSYQKLSDLAPDRNPPVDEISADPSYISHVLKGDSRIVAEMLAE